MSHFTTLVIGRDVEKQLAPFNEQTEDKRFLEFEDKEDEYRNEYENDGTEMIRLSSGELFYPWDDRFKVGDKLWDRKGRVILIFTQTTKLEICITRFIYI